MCEHVWIREKDVIGNLMFTLEEIRIPWLIKRC